MWQYFLNFPQGVTALTGWRREQGQGQPESHTKKEFYEGSIENSLPDDGVTSRPNVELTILDSESNIIDKEISNFCSFSEVIDRIETLCLDLFSFEKSDVNEFYSTYFGVVNLSEYQILFEEYRILGRGLKFCPTSSLYDHDVVKESIDKFFRSANLFLFFSDENTSHIEKENNSTNRFKHPDLKLPSKFNPPVC